MKRVTPCISKEQYEHLARLVGEKEPNAYIERKPHGFGDSLSAFLKEYTAGENTKNNINNEVNFYRLLDGVV